MGSSAALVQTVILPYVSACDLPNTQPVQRVNITSAANSFGTTIAPFFVTVVLFGGIPLDQADAGQLMIPFLAVALCIALTRFVVGRLPLPDIKDTRAAQSAASGRSIWSFRHLRLGVVAVFFYVGAEVAVGQNVNLYAMELEKMGEGLSFLGSERFMLGNLHLGIPALLGDPLLGRTDGGPDHLRILQHRFCPGAANRRECGSHPVDARGHADEQPLDAGLRRVMPLGHVGMYFYAGRG